MILDSSAIIAILTEEPEGAAFEEKIGEAKSVFVSAATVLEACMVVHKRLGEKGRRDVLRIVELSRAVIVETNLSQMHVAIDGFYAYGKGVHLAKLNFGDCFVYALAKSKNLPILCKGTDFAKTDALIA